MLILKPGHLKEDRPVTTFSENKRFSIFFWKRTKIIQASTMQPLKTFKPLNLADFSGNIPQINEYYWSVCVVGLHKNLRNVCFQKVFPVIFIFTYTNVAKCFRASSNTKTTTITTANKSCTLSSVLQYRSKNSLSLAIRNVQI